MKKIYNSILLLLLLLIPGFSFAQIAGFNTWFGTAGDNNWHNPVNWQSGVVPAASDVVFFDRNSNYYSNGNCIITQDVTIKGLILSTDYTGAITQYAAPENSDIF